MDYRNSFLSSIPPVARNLLIINFLIWFVSFLLDIRGTFDLNTHFGLHYWDSEYFNPLQLLTYMFLHGSFQHVFFNMLSLFFFAFALENYWGSKRFLFYYLFCGVGAGIVQEVVWTIQFQPALNNISAAIASGAANVESLIQMKNNFLQNPNIVTIGASGAVFGILLAFGWLFPDQKIYFYFVIPIKARLFVIIYAVFELFLGVARFGGDNIAHFAHIGGALFGLILILWWRRKGNRYNGLHF